LDKNSVNGTKWVNILINDFMWKRI
jgi:hypothetical protein